MMILHPNGTETVRQARRIVALLMTKYLKARMLITLFLHLHLQDQVRKMTLWTSWFTHHRMSMMSMKIINFRRQDNAFIKIKSTRTTTLVQKSVYVDCRDLKLESTTEQFFSKDRASVFWACLPLCLHL